MIVVVIVVFVMQVREALDRVAIALRPALPDIVWRLLCETLLESVIDWRLNYPPLDQANTDRA